MSRRSQLTTKFVFTLLSQLSENFIFIYLGLSLFTDTTLEYKPLFILVTIVGICVARWCAVFPLSSAINWFIRYRARRRGMEAAEEIPMNWKIMIFWAGLRGAVGVALAAGLGSQSALKATVLVVVVLTVIIFGGTTSRMLEILNIRTGVVEEIDSDDEFDIEPVPHANGMFGKRDHRAFGHSPRGSTANGGIGLDSVSGPGITRSYSTSNGHATGNPENYGRRNGSRGRGELSRVEQGLLNPDEFEDPEDEDNDLDLPPAAPRSPQRSVSQNPEVDSNNPVPVSGDASGGRAHMTARGALNQILNATSEDAGTLFSKLDENFLKPHLLLDPGGSSRHHTSSPANRERSGSRDAYGHGSAGGPK
jgi:solute carrier family 9 (sodium/hydrogen exchanger), member 6/7